MRGQYGWRKESEKAASSLGGADLSAKSEVACPWERVAEQRGLFAIEVAHRHCPFLFAV